MPEREHFGFTKNEKPEPAQERALEQADRAALGTDDRLEYPNKPSSGDDNPSEDQ